MSAEAEQLEFAEPPVRCKPLTVPRPSQAALAALRVRMQREVEERLELERMRERLTWLLRGTVLERAQRVVRPKLRKVLDHMDVEAIVNGTQAEPPKGRIMGAAK